MGERKELPGPHHRGKAGGDPGHVTYGIRPFNWGLLAFTLALGAVLFALAWRKVQDEEV